MAKSIINEVWVRMPFCNYKYAVSNHGRVKSCYSISSTGIITNKETILKFSTNRNGYYIIGLCWNDKGGIVEKTCKVHRLVAIHFQTNHDNKPEVNHKDLNKLNNYFRDLEWATSKENTNHAQLNGARPVKNLLKVYTKKGYVRRHNYKPIIDLNTGIFYTSKELAFLKNTTPKEICRLINEEKKPNTTQYRYA